MLRGFLLGGEGLAADWYWMKALQHVGVRMGAATSDTIDLDDLRDLNINLLYPYLDAATDLDPHFLAAYSYGAIVLPAIDRDHAIAIAEKGIRENPGQWRLLQHLGYIYWRSGEYELAADAYSRGANLDGSPPFLKLMAATMRSDAGSRATAREIYAQLAQQVADEATAAFASQKLAELDKLDAFDELDRALYEFREQNGHCPTNLPELTKVLLRGAIADNPQFRVDSSGRFVDAKGNPYAVQHEACSILRGSN